MNDRTLLYAVLAVLVALAVLGSVITEVLL